MGQVIQVNGDYNIKANNINLDVGVSPGAVTVTGDLIVEGTTITVESENVSVKDNIITLNYSEPGPGVTLGVAGLEIDRGTTDYRAAFIFNESDDTWLIGKATVTGEAGSGGPYTLSDSKLRVKEIKTDSTVDSGDLTLIGFGTGVVKVTGTTNYRLQVTDPDDIPNKDYVDDRVENFPSFQIKRSNTRVVTFDTSAPLVPALSISNPIGDVIAQPAVDQINIIIDDVTTSRFYKNEAEILANKLRILSETSGTAYDTVILQTVVSNSNLKLETNGSGKVEITYATQLNHVTTGTPGSISNSTVFYGAAPGTGSTGLYFVNTSKDGEVISKDKALLFSMLF